MVKVAVAGATSHIGGWIIPAIAEKHEVVALSRKPSDRFAHLPNVHHIAVDYADSAALDAALQGVHTVISTIFDYNKDTYLATSFALLHSALRVGAKRFAPSEFAARGLHDDPIEIYRSKPIVADAVRESGIEYTLYDTGFWMNMLAVGTPGADGVVYKPIFDVENLTASIPGDGSAYIVYIRGEDIGKFVAASLELEKWPEVSRMVGDRKTFAEILRIAEEVRGKKFNVTYLSLDALKSGDGVSSTAEAQFFTEVLVTDRWSSAEANLNTLFPEVKPMGIEEFLKTWWGKA